MGPGPWNLLLALAPIFFNITGTALLAAHRLARRARPDPSRPIAVLKPVAGDAPGLSAALESFLLQKHERFQVIFGIGSENDPARPVIEALMARYPTVDAQLVIAGPPIGPNRKVTNLHYMLAHAKYDLILISDDDIRARPDLLSRLAGEIRDPRVGIVTCGYRIRPRTPTAALRGLTLATEFFPSVLMARSLERGLGFTLGAATLLRRQVIDDIGGIGWLADYLAEDYLIGRRARKRGWKIRLSRETVEMADEQHPLPAEFSRQLRWARTYRTCRPVGFSLSLLTHGLFFAALLAALPIPDGLFWAAGLYAVRIAAGTAQVALWGPLTLLLWAWLLPVRDLLALGFWALSFTGSRVRWRDNVFRVGPGGLLFPENHSRWRGAANL